jgi:MFS family permease
VGASHKYQYLMFGVFALKWFFSAMFLMSLNFLFYTEDFTCRNGENGDADCYDWVCNNGGEEFWRAHLDRTPQSLSYVFGLYICDREWVTSLIQSLTYWGSFVGFIIFPFIADNFGRKKAEGVSWLIAVIGSIILSASFNI